MAKRYQITYTVPITKMIEAESHDEAQALAEAFKFNGAKVSEVKQIKSRQQYYTAKREIANQKEFTEIPLFI